LRGPSGDQAGIAGLARPAAATDDGGNHEIHEKAEGCSNGSTGGGDGVGELIGGGFGEAEAADGGG